MPPSLPSAPSLDSPGWVPGWVQDEWGVRCEGSWVGGSCLPRLLGRSPAPAGEGKRGEVREEGRRKGGGRGEGGRSKRTSAIGARGDRIALADS